MGAAPENDIAALSYITAIRASLWDMLFPSEMDRTGTSGTRTRTELHIIYKIGFSHFLINLNENG